jgi:hypothetical protein
MQAPLQDYLVIVLPVAGKLQENAKFDAWASYYKLVLQIINHCKVDLEKVDLWGYIFSPRQAAMDSKNPVSFLKDCGDLLRNQYLSTLRVMSLETDINEGWRNKVLAFVFAPDTRAGEPCFTAQQIRQHSAALTQACSYYKDVFCHDLSDEAKSQMLEVLNRRD